MAPVRLSIIAAVAANGVIGDGTGMPWRLSTDMKRFRALTMGKPVVVGRKTFETFGKPLAGRTNIVVSRRQDYRPEGAIVANSLDAALALAEDTAREAGGDEVMMLGGGEIYAAAMDRADRLYITHVEAEPDGSVRLPAHRSGGVASGLDASACRPANGTARPACSASMSASANGPVVDGTGATPHVSATRAGRQSGLRVEKPRQHAYKPDQSPWRLKRHGIRVFMPLKERDALGKSDWRRWLEGWKRRSMGAGTA